MRSKTPAHGFNAVHAEQKALFILVHYYYTIHAAKLPAYNTAHFKAH